MGPLRCDYIKLSSIALLPPEIFLGRQAGVRQLELSEEDLAHHVPSIHLLPTSVSPWAEVSSCTHIISHHSDSAMPEENWAAHGGVQACDLCHARKVCGTARHPPTPASSSRAYGLILSICIALPSAKYSSASWLEFLQHQRVQCMIVRC